MTLIPSCTNDRARNVVQSFSENGLIVQKFNSGICQVGWPQICGISAGWIRDQHDWEILVMILDLDLVDEELLTLVCETEAVWCPLTQALPALLPNLPEFEVWAHKALNTRMPISIYDRP